MQESKVSITRRRLLQAMGATAAATGLSGLSMEAQAAHSIGANPVLLNKYAGKNVYHCCLRNCPDRCFLKFSVQNGRMTFVTGDETQKFKTAGTPCVKGLSYVEYTYAPDRILHPMRRVGPKGSGRFVRITWDEAYKEIATKWKEIIDKYGAEAILPYSYSGNYGTIGMYAAAERLWNYLGTSQLDRTWCGDAGWVGMVLTYGGSDGCDVENVVNSDLYISWGFNESATNPHGFKLWNIARDKGAKMLCVNTLRTPTASQADVWLQPYPGTDNWVAMGMIKYFIEHNLVDMNYVQNECIGYDEVVKQAESVSWDDIEKTTRIPREKIMKFAKIYGEAKRPILKIGAGIQRNLNGGSMVRAIAIAHALTGKNSCEYGIVNDNWVGIWGQNRAAAQGKHFRKGDQQHVNITDVWKSLDAKNPTAYGKPIKPIKSMLIYNGNPVACSANSNKVIEGMCRDDLFVIGFDMIMTDSMQYCDLVLPSSSQFETSDLIGDYHWYYMQYCEKVIDPIGESKPNLQFFNELAKALGITDPTFDQTPDDIIKIALDTDAWFMEGITLERLKKERWIKIDKWCNNTAPQHPGGLSTPSKKVELYSEEAKKMGFHPVIDLRLSEDYMEDVEKDQPFRLITPAIPYRVNSSFYNVKYIRNFNAYECAINPVDAEKLGIKTNDRVRLFNHRGEAHFVARVSKRTAPGVLMTAKCNWMATNPYGKSCTNVIAQDKLADMGHCSAFSSTRCNIEKI